MKTKHLFSVTKWMAMVVGLFALNVLCSCEHKESRQEVTSGDYGPHLQWFYNENTKTLVFTGFGEMPDMEDPNLYPWKNINKSSSLYFGNITSIELPDGLTSIAQYAFSFSKISSIEVPHNVTRIGEGAFVGCDKLKIITIGQSVKLIEDYALGSTTTDISEITIINYAQTPQNINRHVFMNGEMRDLSNSVLYVPKASIEKYKNAAVWCMFGQILPIE